MKKAFLLLLSLLVFCARVWATETYYVNKAGSDSNSCATAQSSTPSNAKLTTNAGWACLSAADGDTLIIGAGTYVEQWSPASAAQTNFVSGTNFTNAATIKGDTGATVIIKPGTTDYGPLYISGKQYIKFENLIFDAENIGTTGTKDAYAGWGADFIRFTNVTFRNSPNASGIFLSTASDFNEFINCTSTNNGWSDGYGMGAYITGSDHLLDGVTLHSNYAYGIQVYNSNSSSTTNRNVIRNSTVYNNGLTTSVTGACGILLSSGSDNKAYNNIVRNHSTNSSGLECGILVGVVGSPSTNALIYGNTLVNNGAGYQLQISGGSPAQATGTIVRNNILVGSQRLSDSGVSTTKSNNIESASGSGLFVNMLGLDFHLVSGSAAIDAGFTLGSPYNVDIEGTSRPQGTAYDAGAYEFTSDSITLNAPNGGESWQIGTSQNVTFNFTGTTGLFDITYDPNNDGTFEVSVADNTSNTNFPWTVPSPATVNGKMQVCDSDGSPCDISAAVFSVTSGAGGSFTKIISDNTTGTKIGDITGTSDAFIWNVNPTINYATRVDLQPNKVSSSDHSHVVIRFDGLTQIPTDATINSVTLGFYLYDGGTATAQTFDIRRVLKTWVEAETTWNLASTGNSWTTAGGLSDGNDRVATASAQLTGVTLTPGFYSVTSTDGSSGTLLDDVRKRVNRTYSDLVWHVSRNGTGNDGAFRVFSSSEGTNGQRPYQELTYTVAAATITVTEPTSISYFAPGQSIPIRWQSNGVSGDLKIEILRYMSPGTPALTPEVIIPSFPHNQSDASWTVTVPACSSCIMRLTSLNDPSVTADSQPFRIGGTLAAFTAN